MIVLACRLTARRCRRPLLPSLRSGTNDALQELPSLHAAPVTAMKYNEAANCVISTDAKGAEWVLLALTLTVPAVGCRQFCSTPE